MSLEEFLIELIRCRDDLTEEEKDEFIGLIISYRNIL